MNISHITETLHTFFEKHRVIFWNDADGEFSESLADIAPDGVAILRVAETGALAAKIRLELDEPQTKFLVYAAHAQPEPDKDWLLDVRKYSKNFTADSASLLLNELGLQTQKLRDYLNRRKVFFAGKDRLARLKQQKIDAFDGERELDKKMIAVIVRADQPETFTILLKLFTSWLDEAMRENAAPPEFAPIVFKELEKYDLFEPFWNLVRETFGYQSAQPNLYELAAHLFVTDFARHAAEKLPNHLKPLFLESSTGGLNASVFLANWRNNVAHQGNYRKIAEIVEREINAADWIEKIEARNLTECETFEIVERRVIRDLRDRLLAPLPSDTNDWRSLINARLDRFWARGAENSYRSVYAALAAALDFQILRDRYEGGFNYPNAAAIFSAYEKDLYKFDQTYRQFCEFSGQIKFAGWDVLKPLAANIENAYGNWFLENLAVAWGKAVEHEKLFENWKIEGAANQYNFFGKYVKPLAVESAERKIYVIISDAFRYECAEELTRMLNTEARKNNNALLEANLSALLGVVPSYTALGKAVLLPFETIDYKTINPNADVLYTDGASSAGMSNRNSVMNKHNGLATTSEEFIKLGKDAGREFVRDARIIYIYHDLIDSIGDSASSESETFDAVRQTLGELRNLVNYIFNSLNGSQILITADHGFLFQENAPAVIDKSSLDVKSADVLKRKKRYVINQQLSGQENAWHGKIANTAHINGAMEFLIPKGANRFHFSGGARFVHGGAMPQEICVPLITIKKLRGKTAEKSTVSRVGITLLGNLTRIVNNVQRFEFIQTEAVSERNLPRTVKISMRDENGVLISNEQTVTFDSSSNSMDDRRKNVAITLRTGNYDRTKTYALVLTDSEAVIKEYLRYPLTIDIAFGSDF